MRKIKRIVREWIDSNKNITFVISQITYKELSKKNNETNLGMIWNILNPLLYMVVLSTYYGGINTGKGHLFPVYVFLGVTMFNFYSEATMTSMHSLVNNRGILSKAKVPFETFIIQRTLLSLRDYLFSSVSIIPILYFFDIHVGKRVLLLIPLLIITTFVFFGIGEILAVIFVFFADIDHLYGIFITLMTLVSGVFIPIEKLPERFNVILAINPVYLCIEMSRKCLMYNEHISYKWWLLLIAWGVWLCLVGMLMMKKNKNNILNKC